MDTNWLLHVAVVTFDDNATNMDEIKKALGKAGFYIEGEPTFVK